MSSSVAWSGADVCNCNCYFEACAYILMKLVCLIFWWSWCVKYFNILMKLVCVIFWWMKLVCLIFWSSWCFLYYCLLPSSLCFSHVSFFVFIWISCRVFSYKVIFSAAPLLLICCINIMLYHMILMWSYNTCNSQHLSICFFPFPCDYRYSSKKKKKNHIWNGSSFFRCHYLLSISCIIQKIMQHTTFQ